MEECCYFVCDWESPTILYLKGYLQKKSGILGNAEIFYHNEGYFMVRIEVQFEKDKMLFDGPFTIANRPIIVKE